MELILVVNSGSSSHKCSLFEKKQSTPIWSGHVEWKEGYRDAHLTVKTEGIDQALTIDSAREGLEKLLDTLPHSTKLTAVGHRVVHGGEIFQQTTLVTDEVKKNLSDLAYLAPLHNPANLEGIETTERLFPNVPQFAAFDTAFHASLSEVAATYPIPYAWRAKGVRRYGFHGISHAYCSKRAASFLGKEGKMIVCHLGAGASLCAVKDGKSVDTTMGMTPLEGLMMASRSGSIDPGLLLHLLIHEKLTPQSVDHMLNKESGLLGVSGISEDLRDVLEAAQKGNEQATLAFDLFIHRLVSNIAMMAATLGGLEILVFTAGIGENAQSVREKACEACAFLGVKLDPEKNRSPSHEEREISTTDSKVQILVIPTQEEWEISNQVRAQLS